MLHRLIIVNFITECLEMTKKWSIFKCCFLAVNGLNWGILAKNRITRIFFTLFFAKKRKFVSLFVLQIFAFKLVSHQFLVVSTIIRYQCPLWIWRDIILGEKSLRTGVKTEQKCYLWASCCHFSTNFRLIDCLHITHYQPT